MVMYGRPSGVFPSSMDVNIQDQTTDTVIIPLVNQLGSDNLAAEAVPLAFTVTVTDSTGMTIGDHFRIINVSGDRYYIGTILGITGPIITLDSSIDFAYEVGSEVTYSSTNMAVDGSVTPVHFHLRTGAPSIPSSIDITTIIMVCQTSSAVDLNKFGDISPPLTRGLVLRQQENTYLRNILNIKSNADLAGLAYDWTPYDASNPAIGIDGFAWRLTFAGPTKIGVAIRIEQAGQLGMIVQDDLTSLTSLFCVAEGHVVE